MSIDTEGVYADDIYDEPSPPINPNTLLFLYQLAFYTEGAKSVPRTELDTQQRKFSGAMQDHLNDLLWGRAQFVKYNDLKLPPMIDMLRMFHKIETALVEVEMAVSPVEIYEFEHTNAFGFFHSMVSVGESVGNKEYVKKKPVALWQKLKAEGSVIVPMHQAFDLAFSLVMARQEVVTRDHRLNLEDNPHRDQWMSKSADFMTSSPVIIEFFTQAVGVHKLTKKLLHDYLQSFRWHDIKWEENVLNWSQQKEAIYEVLSKKQKHFKRTFWLNEKDFILPSFPEGMKPTETILALDEDGELMAGATRRVDGSEHLQIRVRPQQQFNQMDISQEELFTKEGYYKAPFSVAKTTPQPPKMSSKEFIDEKVMYELTRNDLTREIFINGKLLACPRSGSPANNLMVLLLERNEEERHVILKSEELRSIQSGARKRPIPRILSDLGFSNELRKTFFPSSSNEELVFLNPIHQSDLDKLGFKELPKYAPLIERG